MIGVMQGHLISNSLTAMKGEEVSSEGVLPATPKSEDETIADVKTENDIKLFSNFFDSAITILINEAII